MRNHRLWLDRFDSEQTFIVNKSNLIFNGEALEVGSVFDKSLVNVRRLRQLYENRKIVFADDNEVLTEEQNSVIMPEIKTKGAWLAVYAGNEQIGKSVRTEEEAQEIIDEWLEKQTAP